ncbi:uncharacterized protein LOC141632959 [Silene latifolia]|uniref:uncharacterized protein LOC141632959 n=1 Tax=Silene latifolia TaxID=37657 RepID=UPI003D775D94
MRTDVVEYSRLAAFYHFYSAFSCLAIPFSDFQTRDYIYACMRTGFFVNPKGIILHTHRALDLFFYYSPDSVPFLDTNLNAIDTKDDQLRSRLDPMYDTQTLLSWLDPTKHDHQRPPLSLAKDILLCHPNLTLRRLHHPGTDNDVTTVGDLSRKYVGLYLCIDGRIMELIKEAHDNCLAKKQQLEIVLVCLPFYDEPDSYNKCLDQAVQELNITSWFRFEYNSKVCRRLWRIFGNGYFSPGEKFIIIPPNCESGELCGREVITNFGINEYPFTRTAILRRRLEYVRSLTPLFPLLFNNNNCLIQNGEEFKAEQLQGKNVLLYLSWCERELDSRLMKHYPDIKAKGWEVVFVPLAYTDQYWNGQRLDRVVWENRLCLELEEMPWPFMTPSAAAKACIKEKLFFVEDHETSYLFAVGKDGSIVSRDVQYRLETYGVTESLFADDLELDLASPLADMPLFEN